MPSNKVNYTRPLILLTILFFMWGFLTSMNDILIPFLKNAFDLTQTRSMLVQFAFFIAYFVGSFIYFIFSITSGDPINKIGYKNGLLLGLIISALGAALFFPAAENVSFPFFLIALFILGLGFSILQISANPYVAILGDEKSASGRLNLSQAFNSLGTTTAPLIGAYLIFHFFASDGITAEALKEGASDPNAVKIPYLIFSGILMLVAIFILFSKLPKFQNEDSVIRSAVALKYPHVIFGMLAIFFYVGGEVSVGSNLIAYFKLPEIAGLTEDQGAVFVSLYWGGMMVGRFMGGISISNFSSEQRKISFMLISMIGSIAVIFSAVWMKTGSFHWQHVLAFSGFSFLGLGAFIVSRFLPGRTLMLFALINCALLCGTVLASGMLALWLVVGIGVFNSIMWSNIFTLAIEGLGKYKSQASSLLVMMVVGGALFPLAQGFVADQVSVQSSFLVPIIAFLYIAWYGWKGHVPKQINSPEL